MTVVFYLEHPHVVIFPFLCFTPRLLREHSACLRSAGKSALFTQKGGHRDKGNLGIRRALETRGTPGNPGGPGDPGSTKENPGDPKGPAGSHGPRGSGPTSDPGQMGRPDRPAGRTT